MCGCTADAVARSLKDTAKHAISFLRSSTTATIVRRWPSIVTPFDSGKQAGYCGASARIKFDGEQFVALSNELQARGDKTKLMQLFGH